MSQLPRAQLQGSIDTPGLAVLPPVDPGVTQMNQLLSAFGQVGSAASQIGNIAARETNRREREQDKIDATLAGQAAIDVGKLLPEFEAKVANGEYDALFSDMQEGETVASRVEAHLNQRFDESTPKAYREQVMKYLPRMTQTVVSRQQAFMKENQEVLGATQIQAVATAQSGADLEAITAVYAKTKNISVAKADIEVAAQMAELVKRTGDTRQIGLFRAAYEDKYPVLVQSAAAAAEDSARENANQARIDANREVTNRLSRLAENGVSESTLEGFDQIAADYPQADAAVVAQLRSGVEKELNTSRREAYGDMLARAARSGMSPEAFNQIATESAKKYHINQNEANAIKNDRIIATAAQLADQGDVAGVDKLSGLMTRATEQEKASLSTQRTQAVTKRRQLDADIAEERFKANKQAAFTNEVNGVLAAYEQGVPMARALPGDDITMEIDGREVTIRKAEIRKAAHQAAIMQNDAEILMSFVGDAGRKMSPDQLYQAAAEKAGGPGKLEAQMLSARARLVDKTGLPDPQIERLFATSRATHIPVGTQAAELGPETEVLGDVFDQLDRLQLAKMHMDADTYRRFTLAKINVASGRANTFNDGLVMAAHPPAFTDTPYKPTDEDFADRIDTLIDDMGITQYSGRVQSSILANVNAAIDAGAERTAALEYAANIFQRDNIVVNGAPVEHNGVGASQGGITGLFDVLKDYAAKTEKAKIDNLPNGTDNLVMYRDPRTGQTTVMDASTQGGVILSLTDEQVQVLADDFTATQDETALFLSDTRKRNRAQRWANNEPLISELPGITFRTGMALANVEGYLEGKPLGSQIAPGAGQDVAITPPRPLSESKDPKVKAISDFIRTQSTRQAVESFGATGKTEEKMLEINTRR